MTADTLISPMPTYEPATDAADEHREALARRAAVAARGRARRRRSSSGRCGTFGSRLRHHLVDGRRRAHRTWSRGRRSGHRRGLPRHRLPLRRDARHPRRRRGDLPRPSTWSPSTPEQTVAEQDAEYGPDLFATRPRPVLRLRKVAAAGPGAGRATTPGPPGCAATSRTPGRRTRSSTGTRRNGNGQGQPARRAGPRTTSTPTSSEHGVLVNPLLTDGYASIGCAPCTRRVGAGEDPRAGRWAGTGKTECGIHLVGAPA